MNFTDPKVASVFARYDAREQADTVRMRELGPAAFPIRDEFLLPVGPEVGAFLHALILARRPRRILELGTSYGYSTLFLADAARAVGARVVTMELADYKQAHAREQQDLAVGRWPGHVDRRGDLDVGAAERMIDVWQRLGIERVPASGLLGRVWELRENLSAYDAAYVALAEALESPLVTADGRLARAPGPQCTITVVRR